MPNRPYISLKLATSLDGKIALSNGVSKWITSEEARAKGRELRATHDAVMIGSNTAVEDNPRLTTRMAGAADPLRVVFDSRLRLSATSNLVASAREVPVLVFTIPHEESASKALKKNGISVEVVRKSEHGPDISEAMKVLAERGITKALIEGGGTLAASFLRAGIVDSIHWFRAPVILGGDGRNCIGDMKFDGLDNIPRYARKSLEIIGPDTYEVFEQAK